MLTRKQVKGVVREPAQLRSSTAQVLFISVVMGLIFLQVDSSQKSIQDRLGSLFFSCVFIMFSGILGPFFLFPTERKIFLAQNADGLYPTFPYYMSKVIGEVPLLAMQSLVFCSILYWLVGYKNDADAFFLYFAVLLLINQCAFSVGIFAVVLFPDPAVALNVFPLFFLPIMIFSGFYLNAQTTPDYFIWCQYISYLRYGFRAVVNNEFTAQTFRCTEKEIKLYNGVCPYTNGEQVKEFWDMDGYEVWQDILILLTFIVGLHTINYLLLRRSAAKSE